MDQARMNELMNNLADACNRDVPGEISHVADEIYKLIDSGHEMPTVTQYQLKSILSILSILSVRQ